MLGCIGSIIVRRSSGGKWHMFYIRFILLEEYSYFKTAPLVLNGLVRKQSLPIKTGCSKTFPLHNSILERCGSGCIFNMIVDPPNAESLYNEYGVWRKITKFNLIKRKGFNSVAKGIMLHHVTA